jgi:hypothetical protein
MDKKGVSITFNTIVIAAIALIVLIVLWAIFIGGIKKGAGGIGNVEDESVAQVNDVSWCLPTSMTGGPCKLDNRPTSGCEDATLTAGTKDCKLTCDGKTGKKHKIDTSKTAPILNCGNALTSPYYLCCQ